MASSTKESPHPQPGPYFTEDSHPFTSAASSPMHNLPGALGPLPLTSDASSPGNLTTSSSQCLGCNRPISGQFVRALGATYHLDCFTCQDCNCIVASKFYPIEGPDGKQYPLCKHDYFSRLNLICVRCEGALTGSYISACDKKFHLEHFTCSVCPTIFGAQDSYYEHEGDVYCYFHYTIRFATKCVGCDTAIVKQFVEINRNSRDECWHPECYMIHKFWNVRLALRPNDPLVLEEPSYQEVEEIYNATTWKEKQLRMELMAFKIWTNLSSYEESSAGCISDLLRHVTNGTYLEGIKVAERFIRHIEILFASIDELDTRFLGLGTNGITYAREAKMLCHKSVNLFTTLSETQETPPSQSPMSPIDPDEPLPSVTKTQTGMNQELLASITGLAHYLKILLRITLVGALKLDREYGNRDGLEGFLESLQCFMARECKGDEINTGSGEIGSNNIEDGGSGSDAVATVSYGYKSLAPESLGKSPFSAVATKSILASGRGNEMGGVPPPSDLCTACKSSIDEPCVRLGAYQRWHLNCIKCQTCSKVAVLPVFPKPSKSVSTNSKGIGEKVGSVGPEGNTSAKISTPRRSPGKIEFRFSMVGDSHLVASGLRGKIEPLPSSRILISAIYCAAHSPANTWSGFQAVSRLEQYAFLLNVALRRLFLLIMKNGSKPEGLTPKVLDISNLDLTDKVTVGEQVTWGGYSMISRGVLHRDDTDIEVAVKSLLVQGFNDTPDHKDRLLKRFYREALLWRRLEHPNIVPLLGHMMVKNETPTLISPWYTNGNVIQYLASNPNADRHGLALDVIQGLNYLHSILVVHGDLKGENVLVDDKGRASLCDFGMSQFIDEACRITGFTTTNAYAGGTDRFLCPELLLQDIPKSIATDMWALGCLIVQILTDVIPYSHITKRPLVISTIMRGEPPVTGNNGRIGSSLWDCINKCWSIKQEDRPKASELVTWLTH